VLVRALEKLAHRVAPDIIATRVPMLFEERGRSK
jgi:hypothetical protein